MDYHVYKGLEVPVKEVEVNPSDKNKNIIFYT